MNSSSVPANAVQPRSREAVELAAQDLARRGDDVGAVVPDDVGEAHRGPLLPGDQPQRAEVRAHHEVAVAALPGGHREALDRRHVDVDGEQVVAPLGAVLGDLVEEVVRDEALAHQAPLHVGDGEEDGVDLATLDQPAQLLEHHGRRRYSPRAISCSERYRARPTGSRPQKGTRWRDRASFRRGQGS